jgi:hypothetical protein
MTKALENQLRAAGYTEAQIAKEARFLDRVAMENARLRQDRVWNYGIHHAGEEA